MITGLVYVASPIDQATPETRELVSRAVEVVATTPGLVAFHPARAFTVGPRTPVATSIEEANRRVLETSHGVLAILPAGTATIGLPREIESAVTQGIPVAVVTDLIEAWSLADVPRWPLTGDGVEDALEWLMDNPREESARLEWHVGEKGRLPSRAHLTDAGFDLYVSEDAVIPAGGFLDVHTDVRVALPSHMWGRIVGRSSTRRKRGLLVIEGVIDAGYRGLIYTGVQNMGSTAIVVKAGERLAQFIPHLNVAGMVESREAPASEFDALPHDGRGSNGFGSSGH